MKLDRIGISAGKLPIGIWNTAVNFIEGRNILIRCLAKNSHSTEKEVVDWLISHGVSIKDLDTYICNDKD